MSLYINIIYVFIILSNETEVSGYNCFENNLFSWKSLLCTAELLSAISYCWLEIANKILIDSGSYSKDEFIIFLNVFVFVKVVLHLS